MDKLTERLKQAFTFGANKQFKGSGNRLGTAEESGVKAKPAGGNAPRSTGHRLGGASGETLQALDPSEGFNPYKAGVVSGSVMSSPSVSEAFASAQRPAYTSGGSSTQSQQSASAAHQASDEQVDAIHIALVQVASNPVMAGRTLETLRKIVGNIIANPSEAKYRQLRFGNPKVQETVVNVDGALEYLSASGFELRFPDGDGGGEGVAVFPEDGDLQLMHVALKQLDEVTASSSFAQGPSSPSPPVSPSPAHDPTSPSPPATPTAAMYLASPDPPSSPAPAVADHAVATNTLSSSPAPATFPTPSLSPGVHEQSTSAVPDSQPSWRSEIMGAVSRPRTPPGDGGSQQPAPRRSIDARRSFDVASLLSLPLEVTEQQEPPRRSIDARRSFDVASLLSVPLPDARQAEPAPAPSRRSVDVRRSIDIASRLLVPLEDTETLRAAPAQVPAPVAPAPPRGSIDARRSMDVASRLMLPFPQEEPASSQQAAKPVAAEAPALAPPRGSMEARRSMDISSRLMLPFPKEEPSNNVQTVVQQAAVPAPATQQEAAQEEPALPRRSVDARRSMDIASRLMLPFPDDSSPPAKAVGQQAAQQQPDVVAKYSGAAAAVTTPPRSSIDSRRSMDIAGRLLLPLPQEEPAKPQPPAVQPPAPATQQVAAEEAPAPPRRSVDSRRSMDIASRLMLPFPDEEPAKNPPTAAPPAAPAPVPQQPAVEPPRRSIDSRRSMDIASRLLLPFPQEEPAGNHTAAVQPAAAVSQQVPEPAAAAAPPRRSIDSRRSMDISSRLMLPFPDEEPAAPAVPQQVAPPPRNSIDARRSMDIATRLMLPLPQEEPIDGRQGLGLQAAAPQEPRRTPRRSMDISRSPQTSPNQQGAAAGTPAQAWPRNTTVVLPVAPDTTVPDWFFERTPADVRAEYHSMVKARETGSVFMTRAMREAAARAGQAVGAPKFATLRVRFPEGVCLQGEFGAHESVAEVFTWVTESLRTFEITYDLILPSRRPLTSAGTIRQTELMPSAILNFHLTCELGAHLRNVPLLRDELLQGTQVTSAGMP